MRCAAVAFVLFAACAQSIGATARVPHPLGAPATAATDVNYELDIEIRDIKHPEGLAHEEVGGVLRPFSTAVTRVFTCSSSEVMASAIAFAGSSGSGDITSSMRS